MKPWFLRGWRFRPTAHPAHTFTRLGALIDGVYAIAATLLVLELRVPEELEPGQLGEALSELVGLYGAFGIGFLQMVVGWLQTRRLESLLRGIDHYATLLMLASLGIYSLTPFITITLARAFADPRDLGSAVRLYAVQLTIALVLWAALLLYARAAGLFRDDLDADGFQLYFRGGLVVTVVPPLAWALAYVAPEVALVLLVSLNVLALLPVEAHHTPEDGPFPIDQTRRAAHQP